MESAEEGFQEMISKSHLALRESTSAGNLPSSASSACSSSSSIAINHQESLDELGGEGDGVSGAEDEVVHPMENFHLSQRGPADESDTEDISKDDKALALEDIARWLAERQVKNVLVLSGAGVSVSAGIPDFRTPGTGLYDNLQKYNLPYPEAVFDVNFYRQNPYPFQSLAKEIWPGTAGHSPTVAHCFVKLLESKGLLLRNYTQNIDGLEVLAGVHPSKVLECHGHFRNAHCIDCRIPFDGEACKTLMLYDNHESDESDQESDSEHQQNQSYLPYGRFPQVPSRARTKPPPTCPACGGYVKPSIVFFGEGLPPEFAQNINRDLAQCDLLIVMGTSLKVQPVSLIPEILPSNVPRVLFNRELVGDFMVPDMSDDDQDSDFICRDVFEPGDCDDSVRKLCRLAGWEAELDRLHEESRQRVQLEALEHASRSSTSSCSSSRDGDSVSERQQGNIRISDFRAAIQEKEDLMGND